jgi:hypothetical protein
MSSPSRKYWFTHADTFGEHLRWGLISMAGVVSAAGLASAGLIWWPLSLLLLIPAAGATLFVSGEARKLHIVFVTLCLASGFGFLAIGLALWEVIESGRYQHSAIPVFVLRALISVLYAVLAWVTHQKVKSLRAREGLD